LNKLLFLPTRYFPAISGAEFYIQRIAEILNNNYCYSVDIITSNAIDFKALRESTGKIIDKKNKYYNKVNNIKIQRYKIEYNINYNDALKFLINLSKEIGLDISQNCIKKLLLKGPYIPELIQSYFYSDKKYDLIHTTFYPYFNILISLFIGKALDIPVIITPFYHFANPKYNDPDLMEILRYFDIIIACTNKEKEFLRNSLNIADNKIRVIPMGVDYQSFNQPYSKKQKKYFFKEKFFRPKEKNYKMVLFCGYKNYEKGALSILKAIPLIIEKFKKVYFVFIGPSTKAFNRELSKVLKIKNSRIINFTPENLTGYFDRKKISAFQETNVFVMPSRSDAFGIAYLEAWSAGKPVIGAKIGATPEVIDDNKDGFLVEFDNPKDIAEKVLITLKHPRLAKKMGKNGNIKVLNNYTWEIIAKKTHELYRELLK